MKTRFNIYESLERSFLALQTKIKRLYQGSVVRSLLYSVASELEQTYGEIDQLRRNAYVDTATGAYLDSLIGGLANLKRKEATHAEGYVVVELAEELTDENIHLLSFSFAHYDKGSNTVNFDYSGTVEITAKSNDDKRHSYYICQPQSFGLDSATLFDRDPVTKEQRLLSMYKDYLLTIYNRTGKGIRRLILPIVSAEAGQNKNLQAEEIDFVANIGMPVVIQNLFYVEANPSYNIADVDNVLSLPQGVTDGLNVQAIFQRVLGDYSYISGGSNREGDNHYRDRYYLYLDSLSRGTLSSLEFAVKTYVPNVRVKALESGSPGIVNVYVDSPQVISKNLLSNVNDVISDYRSAGILVNLRPTKVEYLNVLTDLDATSLETATERARSVLSNAFDNKDLAETVTYTEIHELLDLGEIRKTDNVYYGLHLSPEIYALYYKTIDDVLVEMIPNFEPTINDARIDYLQLFNKVLDGEVILFDSENSSIQYPLVQLVRAAREMDHELLEDARVAEVVETINTYCSGTSRANLCLERVRSGLNADNKTFQIYISDLEEIVGKWYSNYFKIKMLTFPPVRTIKSEYAEDFIVNFMKNDVINLSYDDLIEVDVGEFRKVRVSRNFAVNEKLYKINSLVGTRKVER